MESPCAQRLLHFLAQPFHTTEPFHGRPGRIALAELLDAVEAVLAACDGPAGDGELRVGSRPR